MRKYLLCLIPAALLSVGAQAQSPATMPAGTPTAEVDPIRCWWRSSAGSVRSGETLLVGLTCAVLDNEAVQVVPDESRLGHAVVQMAPFEVVSGSHPADLHSGQRRFFQYEYTLRIINPDSIGKDVRVPDIVIHYRVNSRIPGNAAIQGRYLVYVLPPLAVRVASMVPAEAPDIRDASGASFSRVETLRFRAGVLRILAITLIAFGSLMALLVVVRLVRRAGLRTPAGERDLSVRTVVGAAMRELGAVQREREQGGWTLDLVARALAATRLIAAAALDRPISQRKVAQSAPAIDGQLVARAGGRDRRRSLSSAVTPEDLTRALAVAPADSPRSLILEPLREAMQTLGAAEYGREAAIDLSALDRSVSAVAEAAKRVRTEHSWPRTLLRRWRTADAALGSQAS